MTSTINADAPRWLTEPEQRAWRAYLRGSRLLEVSLDRALAPHGTQLSEYEVISMLSEAPGGRLRMSALADLVVQSRSRITHTSVRDSMIDLLAPEEFLGLGKAMQKIRDALAEDGQATDAYTI